MKVEFLKNKKLAVSGQFANLVTQCLRNWHNVSLRQEISQWQQEILIQFGIEIQKGIFLLTRRENLAQAVLTTNLNSIEPTYWVFFAFGCFSKDPIVACMQQIATVKNSILRKCYHVLLSIGSSNPDIIQVLPTDYDSFDLENLDKGQLFLVVILAGPLVVLMKLGNE